MLPALDLYSIVLSVLLALIGSSMLRLLYTSVRFLVCLQSISSVGFLALQCRIVSYRPGQFRLLL